MSKVSGYSSGAMVARYTRALSGELAMDEFSRLWAMPKKGG